MPRLSVVLAIGLGAVTATAPGRARAHFSLESPKAWWTATSDGSPQKMAPCGNETTANTSATKTVTKFAPGQTVPVQVKATIAHPGWYRISLKQGGASTQTATTLPDPPTLAASGAQQCTPAFMDNPVWSPTQPVLADKLGLPAGSTSTTTSQSGTKTFNVTIPSTATCTMASPCTLQVVMFMTDHSAGSCNYHHCADIAVETSTGAAGSGGTAGAAGTTGTAGGGPGGATGAAGTGGTTGAAGASAGAPGTSGEGGSAGAPGDAGTTGQAGAPASGGASGGATGAAGAASSGVAGTTGAAGATGAAGSPGTGDDDAGGCGCVWARDASAPAGLGIVLLGLAVATARRRRERAQRGHVSTGGQR
jgi:hypothetical protein